MNNFLEKIRKEGKNIILVSVVGIGAFALCGTVFANGLINPNFSDLSDAISDGIGWDKFENPITFCSVLSNKLCTTTDSVGEVTLEDGAYVSSGVDGYCGSAGLSQKFIMPEGAKTIKFDAEAYTLCDGDHTLLTKEEILEEQILPGGIMGGLLLIDPETGKAVLDWLDMPGVVSCPILSNVGADGIEARVNNFLARSKGNGTIDEFYSMYPELKIQDIVGRNRADQRLATEFAFNQWNTDNPEEAAAAAAAVTASAGDRHEIDAASAQTTATARAAQQNYFSALSVSNGNGGSTQTVGNAFADFVSSSTGTSGWVGTADGGARNGSLIIYPSDDSVGSSTVSAQTTGSSSSSSSSGGGYTSPSFSRPSRASSNFYSPGWSVFSPGIKINNTWLKEFNQYAVENEDDNGDEDIAGIPDSNIEFGLNACQERHWDSQTYEVDVSQYAGQEVNLKVLVKGTSQKYCNLPDHKMWIRADNFEIISSPTVEIITDRLIKNESSKIEIKVSDINGDLNPLGVFIAVNAGGVWKVGADIGLGESESGETMFCQGSSKELTCYYRVTPDYTWGDAVIIYASAYDMAENYTGWTGNWKGVLVTEEFEGDEDDEDDEDNQGCEGQSCRSFSQGVGGGDDCCEGYECDGSGPDGTTGICVKEGDEGDGAGVPPVVTITSGDLTMNLEQNITATITDTDGDADENEVYIMVYSSGWTVGDGANPEKMDCEGTGGSLSCSYTVTPDTDWGTIANISVRAWDEADNTLGGWGDQKVVRVNF